MTNKLVAIINSLKVLKVKKILLYEMKFLVPNYSCLQNPWLGGTTPRSLFSLSSTEFVEPPPAEQNSWVRHWLWEVHFILTFDCVMYCELNMTFVCIPWWWILVKAETCWHNIASNIPNIQHGELLHNWNKLLSTIADSHKFSYLLWRNVRELHLNAHL